MIFSWQVKEWLGAPPARPNIKRTKPMTNNDKEQLCLYRTWTEKINGQPQKMQACYPHNGGGANISCSLDGKELSVGENIKGFLDGKTYQVVKCKYPRCV
jgi:hypothetical protein